ncbi:hypothetical protein OHA74_12170 [Streptomyces phaeochromogenes]|uniref:hypothetical protein n=1 Tax=Streptomyces phaeochromogenes TaxID=1923 RepID=UPI002E297614|nr:hypothetical protein [Streptomyces phaeochromogenes]
MLSRSSRPTRNRSPGPQDCGHDDYHDGHPWHEKPHIWCPGHSYNDDTAVAQPGKEA